MVDRLIPAVLVAAALSACAVQRDLAKVEANAQLTLDTVCPLAGRAYAAFLPFAGVLSASTLRRANTAFALVQSVCPPNPPPTNLGTIIADVANAYAIIDQAMAAAKAAKAAK